VTIVTIDVAFPAISRRCASSSLDRRKFDLCYSLRNFRTLSMGRVIGFSFDFKHFTSLLVYKPMLRQWVMLCVAVDR